MFVRTIGSIFVAYLSLGILTSREVDPADARALSEAAQMANTHATAAGTAANNSFFQSARHIQEATRWFLDQSTRRQVYRSFRPRL